MPASAARRVLRAENTSISVKAITVAELPSRRYGDCGVLHVGRWRCRAVKQPACADSRRRTILEHGRPFRPRRQRLLHGRPLGAVQLHERSLTRPWPGGAGLEIRQRAFRQVFAGQRAARELPRPGGQPWPPRRARRMEPRTGRSYPPGLAYQRPSLGCMYSRGKRMSKRSRIAASTSGSM
jgi:hypothetical protein